MVAPFVSCTVPTLWHEALPLLSAAAQYSHDQGAEVELVVNSVTSFSALGLANELFNPASDFVFQGTNSV
jgi:hypothetical protein